MRKPCHLQRNLQRQQLEVKVSEIDPYLKLSLLAGSWMVEKTGIRNEVAILRAGYLKLFSLAS